MSWKDWQIRSSARAHAGREFERELRAAEAKDRQQYAAVLRKQEARAEELYRQARAAEVDRARAARPRICGATGRSAAPCVSRSTPSAEQLRGSGSGLAKVDEVPLAWGAVVGRHDRAVVDQALGLF